VHTAMFWPAFSAIFDMALEDQRESKFPQGINFRKGTTLFNTNLSIRLHLLARQRTLDLIAQKMAVFSFFSYFSASYFFIFFSFGWGSMGGKITISN
jgi:hypothetical protein